METKAKGGGRKNALADLPEVKPKKGATPAELLNAVRMYLLEPSMKHIRKTYKTTLDDDGIFESRDFAKVFEGDDIFIFASLVHTLLKEDEDDYKKFMKKLETKIWKPYCSKAALNIICMNFAPTRAKYWDIIADEPRKLSDVTANEKKENSPAAAPIALVHFVDKHMFKGLLDSLVKYTQTEFTKKYKKTLDMPKFEDSKEFGLYVIDEGNADCYNAFREFCKDKGEADEQKLDCVMLLSKALKNKDCYDVFVRFFHDAYVYIVKRNLLSGDNSEKMKTYHETYWNSVTNNPNPLPNVVKGS